MEEEKAENRGSGRRKTAAVVLILLALIGLAIVIMYMQYKKAHITTDDAYIEGRIHVIAPRIPGTVKRILVADNQMVRKGDLLAEIDSADLDARRAEADSGLGAERARLAEAEARAEAAGKQLEELTHRVQTARAQVDVSSAGLRQAESDAARAEKLYKREAISKERLEKTRTAYDIAAAQLKASSEQVRLAETAIATQKAALSQAAAAVKAQASAIRKGEAQLRVSDLNLGYTKLYAPSDGQITKKSLQEGNQVQPGQPLMALVALDDLWVVGNFKETQLEKVKAGQRVNIRVDTYPGKVFEGTVESIMAGTGSAFSLFPPENATGNFVKVVQRVPVRIALGKQNDADHLLRVGMSVEPTIIVGP